MKLGGRSRLRLAKDNEISFLFVTFVVYDFMRTIQITI